MSDQSTVVEELAGQITGKLDALEARIPTSESLEEQVRGFLDGFFESDEGKDYARKLTFAADGDALKGSKYARLGMSATDVEFVHNLLTSARQQGKSRGPSEELDNAFKSVSDGEYISASTAQARDGAAIDRFYDRLPDNPVTRARREHDLRNAMDTSESGYGSQLIGTEYVGELWDAPRKLGRIAPLINTFQMQEPTAYLPVEAGLPELLFVPESTTPGAANYATVKTGSNRVQVSAKKFVLHQVWSGEIEEDSIIPFAPFLRAQAAKSLAHYLDSLESNGDDTNAGTGNINLDDANPADTKHYLAFDGIRHAALVDNTANTVDHAGAAPTWAALQDLKALMIDETHLIDWGHPVNPDDLIYLCDPYTADKIAQIDEVLTVDKYGPQATVLNGELARLGRNPLISSIAVSRTEADGKVSATGSNNTLGQVVAFNRGAFVLGWRRQVQVEMERIPATDQTRIVYSLRNGFGRYSPTGAAAGIEAAAVLRNILV